MPGHARARQSEGAFFPLLLSSLFFAVPTWDPSWDGPGHCIGSCGLLQTHQTIVVQLLQSTMRLLECPWLQQQHKGSVEACIRTLALVGECASAAGQPPPSPPLTPPSQEHLTLSVPNTCSQVARWVSLMWAQHLGHSEQLCCPLSQFPSRAGRVMFPSWGLRLCFVFANDLGQEPGLQRIRAKGRWRRRDGAGVNWEGKSGLESVQWGLGWEPCLPPAQGSWFGFHCPPAQQPQAASTPPHIQPSAPASPLLAKGRAILLPMDLDAHISSLLSSGASSTAAAQRNAANYKTATRTFTRVTPTANQWDYKNIIEKLQVHVCGLVLLYPSPLLPIPSTVLLPSSGDLRALGLMGEVGPPPSCMQHIPLHCLIGRGGGGWVILSCGEQTEVSRSHAAGDTLGLWVPPGAWGSWAFPSEVSWGPLDRCRAVWGVGW